MSQLLGYCTDWTHVYILTHVKRILFSGTCPARLSCKYPISPHGVLSFGGIINCTRSCFVIGLALLFEHSRCMSDHSRRMPGKVYSSDACQMLILASSRLCRIAACYQGKTLSLTQFYSYVIDMALVSVTNVASRMSDIVFGKLSSQPHGSLLSWENALLVNIRLLSHSLQQLTFRTHVLHRSAVSTYLNIPDVCLAISDGCQAKAILPTNVKCFSWKVIVFAAWQLAITALRSEGGRGVAAEMPAR